MFVLHGLLSEVAVMSAPLISLHRCCQRVAVLLVARRQWGSSSASPASVVSKSLDFLAQRFYDVEALLNWKSRIGKDQLRKKNFYYGYTHKLYGPDIASAYYILNLGGGFRFVGQSEWFRADSRGKFNWDFLNYKDTPVEEVDMSHTIINYVGLSNLERQPVRTLKLQGCPEVDDWFLAGLHKFQDSLEELDISQCPRITVGGLAALRNLRISSPGLVIILLEEMLPQCQITADGYDLSLPQVGGEKPEEHLEAEG
ncbi:ATP synthase subunit s-like protein isoform X2 [Poecilia reticulata]|uniref:ATP synthase subunit s-like protein isoform X2 n=1 Tax=Poecilia reticulata TaxID=8081 RepID=UPI0004A2DBAC|nr:PREDICTED: ATP synthase subunit s-like protein isoform X2 [Poecilia reticulata]